MSDLLSNYEQLHKQLCTYLLLASNECRLCALKWRNEYALEECARIEEAQANKHEYEALQVQVMIEISRHLKQKSPFVIDEFLSVFDFSHLLARLEIYRIRYAQDSDYRTYSCYG
jgi:hypothetical protein